MRSGKASILLLKLPGFFMLVGYARFFMWLEITIFYHKRRRRPISNWKGYCRANALISSELPLQAK